MNAHARESVIWILVADEAVARLLEWPAGAAAARPLETLTDPAAHATGAALRRDAYGRRGRGSTASAGLDESHQQAEAFARRVARALAEAREARRFDTLHVAAAPRFLGLLRKAWTPAVAAAVGITLDKDLVHVADADVPQHFAR